MNLKVCTENIIYGDFLLQGEAVVFPCQQKHINKKQINEMQGAAGRMFPWSTTQRGADLSLSLAVSQQKLRPPLCHFFYNITNNSEQDKNKRVAPGTVLLIWEHICLALSSAAGGGDSFHTQKLKMRSEADSWTAGGAAGVGWGGGILPHAEETAIRHASSRRLAVPCNCTKPYVDRFFSRMHTAMASECVNNMSGIAKCLSTLGKFSRPH